jgi:hypothetical protein
MGFAAGFQVGQQAVERGLKMREEDKLKRELAQAYAKPETSQGYTAETGQQLEELAKTGAYDIVPQYAPAAEGQTQGVFTGYQAVPKAGLDLQGDMPAAPMSFNPQQVQDYGGRRVAGQFDPMQLQGLQMREAARVIGASGDPVRAAQMLAEATRMEREAVESPLRLEALRTQVDAGKLGLKKSGFELTAAERADADAQKMTDFTAWRSQNPQADFATTTAKAQELGISIDQQFKIASNMTGIKEQAFKASQQRIEDIIKENPSLDGLLKSHKESKDIDPNSHFEVIRGQGDKVSLNRVNTATGEIIQPNVFTGNEAETTAYLTKQAMNPATVIDYTMNLEKNRAAIEKDRAATEASRSTVSYNAARTSQINQMNNALATNLKNSEEAKAIQTQFAALDDSNDPGGSKRQSLITQFNMLSVKAGGTIPTTGGGGKKGSVLETPVEQKKNDDGTYTAFSKDGGKALYNTFNGEAIPLGMTVDVYNKMKADAQKNGVSLITGEDNGRLVLKFAGPDGKFYDDAEKAKYAKPEAKPAAGKPAGLSTAAPTAAASAPTPPTAKPVRAPGESFMAFRDRITAWDRNRLAYEQMVNESQLRERLSKNAVGLQRPLVQ